MHITLKRSVYFWMEKNKKEEKEKQVEYGIAEVGEDATKYGEFISSYFAWVSLPEQKERVEKLEEITEEKNTDKNERIQRKREKK